MASCSVLLLLLVLAYFVLGAVSGGALVVLNDLCTAVEDVVLHDVVSDQYQPLGL